MSATKIEIDYIKRKMPRAFAAVRVEAFKEAMEAAKDWNEEKHLIGDDWEQGYCVGRSDAVEAIRTLKIYAKKRTMKDKP